MLKIIFKRGFFVPLLLGVCLSTTIVLSILLTSEYVAYAQLQDSFDRTILDAKMIIRVTNFLAYRDIYNKINSLSEVSWSDVILLRKEIEIMVESKFSQIFPKRTGKALVLLGVNETHWMGNITLISGSLPKSIYEIAISYDVALALNVSVGDEILIRAPYGNFSISLKVSGIMKLGGLLYDVVFKDYLIKSQVPILTGNFTNEYSGVCIFTPEALIEDVSIGDAFSAFPTYLMKFNRAYIADPWNPQNMLNNLKRIENKIINIALEYTTITQISFYNYLEIIIRDYASWPSAFRLQLTYVTLPGIFAGGLYAVIIGWTYINKRRQEIALLKIRGFSSKKILLLSVIEFLITSILGGILSLILSVTVALSAAYLLLSYYATKYSPLMIILHSLSSYFLASILYGVLFSFLEIIPSFMQAAKISILEGLSAYLERIEKEKVSSTVYLIFAYGCLGLIETMLNLPIMRFATQNLMNSQSALFQVFGFLLFIFDAITLATSPFIIAYSLSRIIAYYASTIQGILKKFVAIFYSEETASLAIKHFARRPARISRTIFIIAIVLSLMLEAGINASSTVNALTRNIRMQVGADYRVDIVSYTMPISPYNLSMRIENISDGIIVAEVYTYWGRTRIFGLPYIKVIAIDEKYFLASFINEECLVGIRLNEALKALFENNGVLFGVSAKRVFNMSIGDELNVLVYKRFGFVRKYIHVKIAGFVTFLPGLLTDIYDAQRSDFLVMLINKEMLKEIIDYPNRLLIHTPNSVQKKEFLSELVTILNNLGIYAEIYVYSDIVRIALNNSLAGIIATMFRVEFIELIALTAFGIYLIFYSEYAERRREFALIIARGLSLKDISAIASIEAILVIIFSFITGFIIAFDFGLSLTILINVGLIGFLRPPPGGGVMIPLDLIASVLLEALSVILSIRLAMRRALSFNLAQELRVHH